MNCTTLSIEFTLPRSSAKFSLELHHYELSFYESLMAMQKEFESSATTTMTTAAFPPPPPPQLQLSAPPPPSLSHSPIELLRKIQDQLVEPLLLDIHMELRLRNRPHLLNFPLQVINSILGELMHNDIENLSKACLRIQTLIRGNESFWASRYANLMRFWSEISKIPFLFPSERTATDTVGPIPSNDNASFIADGSNRTSSSSISSDNNNNHQRKYPLDCQSITKYETLIEEVCKNLMEAILILQFLQSEFPA